LVTGLVVDQMIEIEGGDHTQDLEVVIELEGTDLAPDQETMIEQSTDLVVDHNQFIMMKANKMVEVRKVTQ